MNSDKDRKALIVEQFIELERKYTGLRLCEDFPGRWVIRGKLSVKAVHSETFNASFDILIKLPKDYPESPPGVQETGGRIPKDYHTMYDGTLCLEAPTKIKLVFSQSPTLLHFVDKLLVPYFYSFCYKEQFGVLPNGEYSHGATGILKSYCELFEVNEIPKVFGLLKILADDNYVGHLPCPCGSRKKLRDCHGKVLRDISDVQSSKEILAYVLYILDGLSEAQKNELPRDVLPKALLKILDKKFSRKRVLEKR